MKKSKLAFGLFACSVFAISGAITSCGSKEKTQVKIQFVPSRDSDSLATLASQLEPILEKYAPDYEFEIKTGTSYAAVTEALASDQIDFGFLTASGYAQIESEEPGLVDVLLTSVRDGYQVQLDVGNGKQSEEIRKSQVDAMNGKNNYKCSLDNKSYLGQQTQGKENQVTFYNSICFTLNDEERAKLGKEPLDANGDGDITIDELAGKTVIRQSQTSGAGYLYPSFFLNNLSKEENQNIWFGSNWKETITNTDYLKEHGMTMVEDNPDASKGEIKAVSLGSGYDLAFSAVMNGQVDAAWGFMDIRYANGFTKSSTDYYKDEDLWNKTKTVCMTTPIYNDTISVRSNLEDSTKEAVKNAFIKAAADGDKDTEGTGAYILYNVYSHTGYKVPGENDYDSEVEMYKWKVSHGF